MKEKYKVHICYSGYSTHEIEAENEEEAFSKARKMKIHENDLLSTLESWEDADMIEKINDGNGKK